MSRSGMRKMKGILKKAQLHCSSAKKDPKFAKSKILKRFQGV